MSESIRTTASMAAVAAGLFLALLLAGATTDSVAVNVIVQAADTVTAAQAVRRVGGDITKELGIIHAVAAEMTRGQLVALTRNDETVQVYDDRRTTATGNGNGGGGGGNGGGGGGGGGSNGGDGSSETEFPTLIDADLLHAQGITGRGVKIAFVDTYLPGFSSSPGLYTDAAGDTRCTSLHYSTSDPDGTIDHGHSTHVMGVAASSLTSGEGRFNGIAPSAGLMLLNAFRGSDGAGTYSDVIGAIDWVVEQSQYESMCPSGAVERLRVLNLSFSAAPQSHYWDDPLNQAVMAAWNAGVVVVVSAGNGGPDPTTRRIWPRTTCWRRSRRPGRPTRASSSRRSWLPAATSER
jgi:serine protease AprX